ncbi:MAG: MerR family transcriptional regulator [Thomasclavelia sp.]|uniref:MerR family transcriptional regulator n=1 Tax=Thomasclavelia sp. TaxID=3025757 RepID=UPI0039A365A6
MFKIGEFSKLTQVTVRMLRYYDEMGLLKPAKIDSLTGYRMYSSEQILVLNKIIYLRDSGFSVAEIASTLDNDTDGFIIEQLDKKYIEIEESILALQAKLKKIKLAKKGLLTGKNEMHYNVIIKKIPSYFVLSLRKVIPNYYAESELWKELSLFANKHKINVSANCFSIYHDDDYREENVDVELCVPVNKVVKAVSPFCFRTVEAIETMACMMVYGDFSNIGAAYLSLAVWLQENRQYKMQGASRQIVHRGPWNEDNFENYLTEIQIPLKILQF